jgi:hypothetical protein
MAKLKVYQTRIGFHDAVVAAPNQKTALAAWDVRENLFAQGAASVAEDPQAVKAATAKPGVVLRRAAGSREPFGEAPSAPAVPKLARPAGKASTPATKAAKPKPDRKGLDTAEKALAEFEADARKRLDSLKERRRALDDEARALDRSLAEQRRRLERERDRERRAYEAAPA